MSERKQLEQAIIQLESQRSTLGDIAVDAAITGLKQKLSGCSESLDTGERKLVTVMFADISGFTALSEKMDPEAVRDLMNRCFDHLVPCIKHYDGTIDKFIGDEIMALFGAPLAHENDPERALRAALGMQSTLVKFNAENKTELGIHFGINTGLVLAGGIGSSERQEYSVMGDTVNLAARLEDVSERGQILVGADTYRLAMSLFEFETLPLVSVKGKSEPVAVYRLIGAKAGIISARGLERKGLSSPLVGRGQELRVIQERIESLCNGQGSIVAVIGEAGLGKSRLMLEAHRNTQGVQWLEGRTLSFGQSISYYPFQEILRHYAGIDDDTELEAWSKLERKIVALFPESAIEILPYLATMLAVEVQGEYIERVKYLDGDALGKRVFLAVRRLVERLARTQPLALVFEDLHWMDVSSVELAEHLLALVREVPLLIIGITRPDRNTAGARLQEVCAEKYGDVYTEVRLSPLSSTESTQLVNNLLTVDDLPVQVREKMTQKAEGNPFFIEEIIRSLLDMGAIVRDPDGGRWRATVQIDKVQIPDTVQGVIMARIDRLDEDLKQALRMAAVIGRSFLYRILREIDTTDGALDEHLTRLQQIELIREKQATPELEYIFKHALAQEATYESILLQKRRELHERVAGAIEAIFTNRLDEFYSLLAYHYAKAENWEKAQEYLFKAGDQAGHMAADTEALAHYQQAMDAYVRVFGNTWNPLQRAIINQRMAEAFYRRGEHEKAEDYYYKALASLGYPLPKGRWAVRRQILIELFQHVIRRLRKQIGMNADIDPQFETEAVILRQLTTLHSFVDLEKLLLDALHDSNRFEAVGAKESIMMAHAGLGYACTLANLPRLAEMYIKQALVLAADASSGRAPALTYHLAGIFFFMRGRIAEYRNCADKATRYYARIGDLVESAQADSHLSNCLFHQGELATSLVLCERNIALGKEMQNIHIQCYALTGVAKAKLILGEWDELAGQLQLAIELARQVPNYQSYVENLGYLACYHIRMGHLEQASTYLDEALIGIGKYKVVGHQNLQVYNPLAEICLLKAKTTVEEHEWMQKAKFWLSKGLRNAQNWRTYLPETMRFWGIYEWLKGNNARAIRWWERSLNEADSMGLHYFAALTHLEMGQRLGDREHLQKAEVVFDEVGAKPDLEKVHVLLANIPR